MLELLADASIALLAAALRLPPALRCKLCSRRSLEHPAGPLHRYTRRRVNGEPICRRHTLLELADCGLGPPAFNNGREPWYAR